MTAHQEPAVEAPPLSRNRPYVLLQAGKTAHAIGLGVGAFTVPLLGFGVTGSVLQAGVITAVGELGALLAALPAGVVADRFDRRRVIVVASLVGVLVWGSLAAALFAGTLTGWHLAAVLFASSVAGTFAMPAEAGAIRAVVPPSQMGTAMAVVQGRQAAATLLAGPLGGFLYGASHALPLLLTALGHLAVAGAAAAVRVPLNPDLSEARATHPWAAMREGLRFVRAVPVFRICLWLFILLNVAFGGLLVAINLELVATGTAPILIGLLDLVAGAGLLLGAVGAPWLVNKVRLGPLITLGLAWLAACAVGMALFHSYPAYLVLLGLAVLPVPAVNAGMGGYVVAITPEPVQGRANSVLALTGVLSAPVAPLVGAVLLDATGLVSALWVLAGGLAVVAGVLARLRVLRRIGTPETWVGDLVTEW